MNASIQNARSILGYELVTVFQEACGQDQIALNEMINEAMRAFRIIRQECGWQNTLSADIE